MSKSSVRQVQALKVHQWLEPWNDIAFDRAAHRSEPPHEFYMFSLNAKTLKALSGIQRRTKSTSDMDLGIQRRHEPERSSEISRFVEHGYPWSELSKAKRESGQFNDFKKPGWLPTALVVNILKPGDQRRTRRMQSADAIRVDTDDSGTAILHLPTGVNSSSWEPTLAPIEVIDGQHRLWAFEDNDYADEFDLPVVAFHGLDISWQAYLFWTINIKPKKINSSLAFDLYPLLRSEDWLDKFEGHSIYRDTRAQELVERLWASPLSPWYERINMLGEPGMKMLSQAAWIRSLTATFIRSFEGRRVVVGGLFGAAMGDDNLVLPWSRAQQASFLIFIWKALQDAVKATDAAWTKPLRRELLDIGVDPAFRGDNTLLDQDQGVRGFLHVINDICWIRHDELRLIEWESEDGITDQNDENSMQALLRDLGRRAIGKFIREACANLAEFDWRTAKAPGVSDALRQTKLVFRGSGGYSEFRKQLLKHLSEYRGQVGEAATEVLEKIG
jgi:DGQHR domain-containing protein